MRPRFEVPVLAQVAAAAVGLEAKEEATSNVAEPVEIFAAFPIQNAPDELAIDPVCQMAVDPARAVGRLIYDSSPYFFCSLTCAKSPGRYVE